jgi:hypothetical protein
MVRSSSKFEDDVDELFMLPLAEFTAARNALARQLKQAGRGNDADFVKTLSKPSISAWTVNQLYRKHRDAFDRLLATGERFRQAQTSRTAGMAGMRGVLKERREALSHLSDLATSLLRDAGHNQSPDTIHRITTTLEALSAYSSVPDGPRPGRLTHDVDPPGFESLASLMPGAGVLTLTAKPQRVTSSQSDRAGIGRKTEQAGNVHLLEERRQAKIAAAKASLQDARNVLADARTRANSLAAAQKKADATAKQAEKQKREAERRFEKSRVAWEAADRRARSIAEELEEAADALEEAERKLERASKELDLLVK